MAQSSCSFPKKRSIRVFMFLLVIPRRQKDRETKTRNAFASQSKHAQMMETGQRL